MDKKEKEISKFLNLILRHKPETIGISLDEHGCAGCILMMVCVEIIFVENKM